MMKALGVVDLRRENGLRKMECDETIAFSDTVKKCSQISPDCRYLVRDWERITPLVLQYSLDCAEEPGIEGDIASRMLHKFRGETMRSFICYCREIAEFK